ncbi:MAG: hypothetical protein AAF960_26950 [Bacteroidota bacterium]
MNAVKTYKIVWNTKANQGIFLFDSPKGVTQVCVDSPEEAAYLLDKVRHKAEVFQEKELVYTGFNLTGMGEESATTEASVDSNSQSATRDNLQLIEGIGPKIEQLLNDKDIRTFTDLKTATTSTLKQILKDAGPRFRMHDPGTWGQQAGLAVSGDWEALEDLQKQLKGGR